MEGQQGQTDLAAYWETAQEVDEYVGQLWRKYRTTFNRNRERTIIDDTTRACFAARPLRILILTEPYCEDSAQFVPAIWRLADEVASVDVRIVRQHRHPDLSARYLADGHPAIPVVILLDASFRAISALVERPTRVTAELTVELRRFQQLHPDLPGIGRALERMPEEARATIKQHIATWRDESEQHARWMRYLFEDLTTLACHTA